MVEVAPITILDMIMKKGLKLIYVDTKKVADRGHPYLTPMVLLINWTSHV
jgi:hypothetical protein